MTKENIDPIERLKTIRREAWIVMVNNGWGDRRAEYLAHTIYDLCVEVVGKEENNKVCGLYGRT